MSGFYRAASFAATSFCALAAMGAFTSTQAVGAPLFPPTVTTATPHHLSTGNTVTVVGALPAAYNTTAVITVVATTTRTPLRSTARTAAVITVAATTSRTTDVHVVQ